MTPSRIAAWIAIPLVGAIALGAILFSMYGPDDAGAASEDTAGIASGTDADASDTTSDTAADVPLVAENSHVLDDAGDGAPVLVEFLDFECESCGAVYPVMEQIRAEYRGSLTYVTRYFITGHANSMNAALAAEAAAQQGRYEEMYRKLFETQEAWGEQQDSQAPRFRELAAELGLDLDAYDAAVADPATQARVEQDHTAGLALGVRGTPTFFLDGELLEPQTVTDLTDALDAALEEASGR